MWVVLLITDGGPPPNEWLRIPADFPQDAGTDTGRGPMHRSRSPRLNYQPLNERGQLPPGAVGSAHIEMCVVVEEFQ